MSTELSARPPRGIPVGGVLFALARIALVSMFGPPAGERPGRPECRATGLRSQSADVIGGEGAGDEGAV
ncbi:hypothetical protein ACWEAF_43100 [Streptomyces sp. NPDC005071]